MKFCAPLSFSDIDHYLELARVAEESGWEGVMLSDHVVHPETIEARYPYSADGQRPWEAPDHWPDVWVAMGAMGAVTTRLRFYTGVFVVPMRHPLHLAKAIGTAAVLTGYRVTLGMGMGWMRDEFELLGERFEQRGARADEMVEVMRKLWSGEMVEHHGRFFDFGPLNMRPPVRGEIPIVVGGVSEAAYRRVGRLGDGWMPHAISSEQAVQGLERIRHHRAEAGRADAPLDAIVPLTDVFDPDGFRRVEELGVTHVMTAPWMTGGSMRATLQEKCDALRRYGDRIIAKT